MNAIVQISLEELDNLRNKIVSLQKEVNTLNSQKNFTLTYSGNIYSFDGKKNIDKYQNNTSVYGNLAELKENLSYQQLAKNVRELVDSVVKEHPAIEFYNKCPNWIKKVINKIYK